MVRAPFLAVGSPSRREIRFLFVYVYSIIAVCYCAIQYEDYINRQKRQLIPQPQSGGEVTPERVCALRGPRYGLLQADLHRLADDQSPV